jgi:hypothetical protein
VSRPPSDSTIPEGDTRRWRLVETGLRRLFVLGSVAFVVLGLLRVFGPKERTVGAEGGGYRLEVTYSSVNRPGKAAPWKARVSKVDGSPLPAEVTVRSEADYFDLFDENGFDPQPESESSIDGKLVWTFSVPPGSTALELNFDAFVEPDRHRGGRGSSSVVSDGQEVVTVNYETWVVP